MKPATFKNQDELELHLVESKLSGHLHQMTASITFEQYQEYCRMVVDVATDEYSLNIKVSELMQRPEVYRKFITNITASVESQIETLIDEEIGEMAYGDYEALLRTEIQEHREEQRRIQEEANRRQQEQEELLSKGNTIVLKNPESVKRARAILKAAGLL